MTSVPRTILWLDDERDPHLPRWQTHLPDQAADIVWVRTFEQFVTHIETNGVPAAVCFDHDLGEPQSGLDAAKWLTQYCLKHGRSLPGWSVHSANPIGRKNIESLLRTFERLT